MSASQILRRHRLAVLLGAALVVSPFLLPAGLRALCEAMRTEGRKAEQEAWL